MLLYCDKFMKYFLISKPWLLNHWHT